MKPLTLTAAVAAVADKPRKISIMAYSGGIMTVPGWGPVVIDLAGLAMKPGIPLLTDHDSVVRSVIGAGQPEVKGGQLFLAGKLASTPAAAEVVALLEADVPLEASVGLQVEVHRFVREGEAVAANNQTITAPEGGFTFISKATLKEVSVVPIGADSNTAVRLAASAKKRRQQMPQTTLATGFEAWLRAAGFDPTTLSDRQITALEASFEAEAGRADDDGGSPAERGLRAAADLRAVGDARARITAHYAAENPDKLDFITAAARTADTENWSADRLKLELLQGCRPSGVPVLMGARGGGEAKRVLQAAMYMHLGALTPAAEKEIGADACERARAMHIHSLVDWCKASLQLTGRPVPSSRDELILQASGPSTYSLPTALGDTANRMLLESYRMINVSWAAWCSRKPVTDFRTHNVLRLFTGKGYKEVGNGGELQHNMAGEETYTHQAATFGQLLSITRKDIINDDVGVFLEVPRQLGIDGARMLSDRIYAILLADVAAGTFFSAGHSNYLAGASTALSVSSVEAAIVKFRQQTDSAGKVIDVPPRVLLVPPELEMTARRIVKSAVLERSQATGDAEPTANALEGMLDVAVEPRLSNSGFTGYSALHWYLFASPNLMPTGIVSFLNGIEFPTIHQYQAPPEWLGMSFQAIFDVGFSLADWRGGVRMKGEAA